MLNEEKETLVRFSEVKGCFQPQLPYSNASYYKILSKNLYYPHKVFMKLKKSAIRILRR